MSLIILTDIGSMGLGHYNRCVALAEAMYEMYKTEVTYYIYSDQKIKDVRDNVYHESYDDDLINMCVKNEPNCILLDSYLYTENFYNHLRKVFKGILICFDDYHRISYENCDILINGNVYAKDINYAESIKKKLLSTDYLVMNHNYWDIDSTVHEKYELMITTGGNDPKLMTLRLMEMFNFVDNKLIIVGPFVSRDIRERIHLAKSPTDVVIDAPKNLKNYIHESKCIVTASGSTVYEISRLKKKMICFSYGIDQERVLNSLIKLGIVSLGSYENLDDTVDLVNLLDQSRPLKLKIDGQGARRCSKEIQHMKRKSYV